MLMMKATPTRIHGWYATSNNAIVRIKNKNAFDVKVSSQ